METIIKGELKRILKKLIIEKDPTLLNYLTQEKVNRVFDYYSGCSFIFNQMAEKPYEKIELEKFTHKTIFDFYKEIVT